jgi:diguanylate cyclase (GGDEF)-like protein
MFHEMEPIYRTLLQSSKELLQVIEQGDIDINVMDGIIGTITVNEKKYLNKMDLIVNQYDYEATNSIFILERAELYLFYILLFVMVLKLLLVILPASKTLKLTLLDLTESYDNINRLFHTIKGAQFVIKYDGEIVLMNSDAEKLITADSVSEKTLNVNKNIKWVTINIMNLIGKLEKEEVVDGIEAEIEDRYGNHLYLITSVMKSIYKRQSLVLLSMYDITYRKNAEKELADMAIRDKLTGLYNRTFMDTIITEEIERSERYEIPFSAFILDLDRFKNVNDKWGHPIGDSVLKMTADIILENKRTSDYALRIGGEEFVVLLPHTDIEGAYAAAEKVRKAIEDSIHPIVGKFTASFGVAERNKGETFRLLYTRMDSALYQAKEAGRNCVIQAISDGETR